MKLLLLALTCLAIVAAVTSPDTRDREDNKPYDVIVIGSGSSAIAAANKFVGKHKKVLMLEKAREAGGCTHEFHFNGSIFQSGYDVHTARSLLWAMLELAPGQVHYGWPAGYSREKVMIGDPNGPNGIRVYELPNTQTEYFAWLYEHLNASAADKLIRHMIGMSHNQKADFAMPAWDFLPANVRSVVMAEKAISDATVVEVGATTPLLSYYASLTSNEDLWAVLGGDVLVFLGLPIDYVPASPVLQATGQLSSGFNFPIEGTAVSARVMIENIKALGGKVEVRSEVTKVLFDEHNGKVSGVQLANGTTFSAHNVLSTIGIDALLPLIGNHTLAGYPSNQPPGPYKESGSGFMSFVTMKITAREAGLHPMIILWSDKGLKGMTMDNLIYPSGIASCQVPLVITETTLKTSAFDPNTNPQPVAALEMLSPFTAWSFAPWFGTLTHHRPPEYYGYKEYLQYAQLECFYKFFPNLRGQVANIESGTPLTIRDYVAKPFGAFMSNVGLQQNEKPHYFTGTDGLYFCGADDVGGADKAPLTGDMAAAEVVHDVDMAVDCLNRIV